MFKGVSNVESEIRQKEKNLAKLNTQNFSLVSLASSLATNEIDFFIKWHYSIKISFLLDYSFICEIVGVENVNFYLRVLKIKNNAWYGSCYEQYYFSYFY